MATAGLAPGLREDRLIVDYGATLELWCEEDGPVVRTEVPETWVGHAGVSDAERAYFARNHSHLNLQRREVILGSAHSGPNTRLRRVCPYCGTSTRVTLQDHQGSRVDGDYREIGIVVCPCGFWDCYDWYHCDESGPQEIGPHNQYMRSQALLRRFALSDLDAPLDSLRRHLLKRFGDIAHVHPQTLERLVGDVFGEALNCEAVHVGGPGDDGIDLVLLDADEPLAVQVKRRQRDRTVGVALVREFIGALLLEGHMRGLVVTTASRFSRAARSAASRAVERSLLDQIELVDGDALQHICSMHPPEQDPWRVHAPGFQSPRPPAWPRH
jgi:hypothetical protein